MGENIEHLALMQKILDTPIPVSLIDQVRRQLAEGTQPRARKRKKQHVQTRTRRSPSEQDVEYFLDLDNSCIKWPGTNSSAESIEHVEKQGTLKSQMNEADEMFNLAT